VFQIKTATQKGKVKTNKEKKKIVLKNEKST
jgi:hypothetical protein